ncbi:hypothetical protein COU18_01145 [Candidatus Kaiserbacteria bacterium CG10_big_fil_rev_8_21_14_0_10_51_14]|uniref:PGAP1 family protein n=1 Tax=Candidatus Kaiserbacteria bacterium CG10_big_fil_rev_8_21_14_0_10_51_14 TaxID=1974610 RepID=A0A2H0UC88_9BACT|nr:MAG: hypothetical protein COU18_01145 [Candidatus Kaiserbacteria bacterium CG10_big_fil_rev_8_21_14_0_10_51_14]
MAFSRSFFSRLLAATLGGLVLLFTLPSFAHADVPTTPPEQIGYFCSPYTESYVEGGYYISPAHLGVPVGCTYLAGTVSKLLSRRLGGVFRGVVGSSTSLTGHSLGIADVKMENYDPIPNPQQGENIFTAIWQHRNGPAFEQDTNKFIQFFTTGSPPPHGGYGFINWKWGVAPPVATVTAPVIIIPGILGSEQHNGEWVIDPILHTYDDLIATLDANGYTPDVDLFPFPYDWRKSNVETALLLMEKIDEVKVTCLCDKVDLVAHSMGGLIVRQYIQSDNYDHDVRKLIFLGTPHLGAPKAYLMWEGGELAPITSVFDRVIELVLGHEAKEKGYSNLFEYIRDEPITSVQQLLPTYSYIFDLNDLRQYPQNYPINEFLEELNDDFGNLLNSGIEIHNIIGNVIEQKTITGVTTENSDQYFPMWEHGYPEGFYSVFGDHGLERGSGDNTVPLPSASLVSSNLLTTAHSHNVLPTGAEGDVYHILTNKTAETLSHDFDSLTDKLMHIKILSPADLLVIAPDGKKIGKDFGGQEINEVLNAFYTGFTTNTEYITILNPLDGEYKIFTQGTGSGPYTVEVAYVSEEETTEASFTGNTTPSLVTELKVQVDNENPSTEILPADTDPPQIMITSPVFKDYLRSEQLSVDVSAEDTESGVYGLETFLDGSLIQNTDMIDLFFQSLGDHNLLASSTDNVGNATTTEVSFRVVATQESTLSDIERAHELGWMNFVSYTVVSKLFQAINKLPKATPKVVEKRLLQAILRELQKFRGKGLNEQGYQLLKADIEWLISN